MSISDKIIQAEEVESFEDKHKEQWRKDTEKMHCLDKEWKKGYSGRKSFLCREDEFIERETEKGGRHDWN